jgi:hypothetical protein
VNEPFQAVEDGIVGIAGDRLRLQQGPQLPGALGAALDEVRDDGPALLPGGLPRSKPLQDFV